MRTANGSGDQTAAVAGVLESAGQAVREMSESPQEDPDLARHALKLFITHHPHGVPLRIPTLEERTPLLALPSKPLPAPGAEALAEENAEDRLLWLREDPKLNEHHEHWHVVYPIAGIPAPDTERKGQLKERQGELFFYMHRQMLARYDAERLGVGLDRVVPWDYPDSEPLGYDPGQYLFPTYGSRPPGAWVPTTEGTDQGGKTVIVTTDDMALRGERLFAAASSGTFDLPDGTKVPVDVNLLGATQEADIGTVEAGVIPFDPNDFGPWYAAIVEGFYGNFHNVGHDMFGWLSTNSTPPNNGIMGFVPTACRDHVFFRWHRLIDTLCTTWQDTQPSNDFSDAPPVTIRKSLPGEPAGQSPDIILCLAQDLVPWDRWDEFGTYAFGGDANWDRSFASGSFPSGPNLPTPFTTTDELLTEMRRRVITIETGAESPKDPEQPHEIEYLDQDEFFYFLRLENTSADAQDVTVRVFLVPIEPEDLTEDRVAWIEMDKFKASLAANEKAVVFRPGSLSSVIRKPGVKPPAAEQPPIGPGMQQDALIEANYCDCGWPYNLLLPRGMPDGMHFRLLVMLTDGNIDKVEESSCGSMSFCGARDNYPDSRPMGYPFDRPFRDKTVAETIAAQDNMATRDITIRLRS
jgi:tyrosinase